MDTPTTIIGAVVLLACIVPLVMAHNNTKKKGKRLYALILGYAQAAGSKISQHDTWLNNVIGIDNDTKTIFFIKHENDINFSQIVKLEDVKSCYIRGAENIANIDDANKLELVFIYKNQNEGETSIEFYNREASIQLNDELQLIKKWEAIINQHLA